MYSYQKQKEEYAPKTEVVRLLRLTEKYNNIYMVAGGFDYQGKNS